MMKKDLTEIGSEMHELMRTLYPVCRSITGDGVRKTLSILQEHVPVKIQEVPTGTEVFDWTVPKEWNIRDAYVKNSDGEKIIDFARSNLHVLSYSIPVRKKVSLQELKEHVYTLPDRPDWIPYRTSYYNENWGFCTSHNQFQQLGRDTYDVCIDSSLEDGFLTYGECFIEGKTKDEVLISTHICHPSLCSDNLSGIVLAVWLAKYVAGVDARYSYRFLFVPGTIGSLTWLCMNESNVSQIKHGLVAACLGDSGRFTYKTSRRRDADIDRIVVHALKESRYDFNVIDFFPYGYDERQYCSPGFNLPVGCLMRTPHEEFPEYHTSADNLDFVTPGNLAASFEMYRSVVKLLESNKIYLNKNPKGEPMLGKRGIYKKIGGHSDNKGFQLAILWTLNLSDGTNSLLDISERSKLSFDLIKEAADTLVHHGLLEEIKSGDAK